MAGIVSRKMLRWWWLLWRCCKPSLYFIHHHHNKTFLNPSIHPSTPPSTHPSQGASTFRLLRDLGNVLLQKKIYTLNIPFPIPLRRMDEKGREKWWWWCGGRLGTKHRNNNNNNHHNETHQIAPYGPIGRAGMVGRPIRPNGTTGRIWPFPVIRTVRTIPTPTKKPGITPAQAHSTPFTASAKPSIPPRPSSRRPRRLRARSPLHSAERTCTLSDPPA